MRLGWWKLAAVVVLFGPAVQAQDIQQANWGRRNCPPSCPAPCAPETAPLTPSPMVPTSPSESALSEAFAQAGEGGTMPSASFMPGFFGDLVGYNAARFVQLNRNTPGFYVPVPVGGSASGFKITEHESPRPVDRIYYAFNYYDDVNQALFPNVPYFISRHTIGFEKTFLHGDASVGLRVPFVEVKGVPAFQQSSISDLSIVLKYAFINDPDTKDVLSGGMVITVPTGTGFAIDATDPFGNIVQTSFHPTMLQPWGGFIYNFTPRLYAHGFSSVTVPFDARVVTLLANDVGIGLWLYRNATDRFVQGIIPTFEFHLNTPLTHRGALNQPVGMTDQLNLTGGGYIVLPRSTLGFAIGFPVLGPHPWDVEAIASYTLRF